MNTEPQSFGLPLQRRVLSDGTECSLPIRYFDSQCLIATFLTEMDRARHALEGTGLQAVPQEDGKALVVLACWEYRDTDIGPYNEVALTIVSAAPGDPVPAIYVVDLPVTTDVANRAGRELWGYNKFVATIDIRRDGKTFSTTVHDPRKVPICTLEGTRSASVPVASSDIYSFNIQGGRVIKTHVQVPTPMHVSTGEGFLLKIGNSRHHMAENLRGLGLDDARPVLVQHADPFQMLLFPGRAL